MENRITQNHFQELTTLYEVSKVLSSSMDLEHTLNNVLKTLESHLHISPSMIILRMDKELVGVIAATGLSAAEMERGRYRLGEGMVDHSPAGLHVTGVGARAFPLGFVALNWTLLVQVPRATDTGCLRTPWI